MNAPSPKKSNLLPLAALVSLLVLLLAAVGLFALNTSHRRAAQALDRLGELSAAQVAAVETQVSFKTQVQEWKNILLRGREPKDYQQYLVRFNQAEAKVKTGLEDVNQRLGALGLDRSQLAELIAEHASLGSSYRKALAHYQPSVPDSTFAVDASIRGIDRKLNSDIDALAHSVEQQASAELGRFRAAGSSRYAFLRKVFFGGSALAVLAALCLVFQAARAGSSERTA